MSEKKIIAVVGATGAQGGGLARAILADQDGPFAVRAITRDARSDKARALADSGAEVVEADLGDEASLRRAFDGAYGAYVVTNYWEGMSAETELAQAGNAARAAKGAGLRHVIWSTLEDTRAHLPVSDARVPVLEGSYTVPHFDAKAEADRFFVDLGVPTTLLRTTFYWEAFLQGFAPSRDDSGHLVLSLPMGDRALAGIAAEDIGRVALAIFARGEEFIGETVSIAGEHLTGEQLASAFAELYGEPVAYQPLTHDQFRALGIPAAVEIGNMFQYYTEAAEAFTGARDLNLVRNLHPGLQTFRDWLSAHKDALTVG
ncbi:NmrA/HSCARG family protein [Streptomyces sp. NBC_01717]|uniref:NmrA/HSCARG family protein n=1 Tax=Streptomyces sp. NBC_01717 TaxID=2975918 RepID=UPI002E34C846|nr:NmrA/HSCARG family protein [Streptomyces sp. NBC_01717]